MVDVNSWMGEIPSNWKVSRIGNAYTARNEKVSDLDYPPLSVTMKGVVPQLATAAKSDDHGNRKLVKKGDFCINSRSDRRGSCGISAYDGSVSLINTVLAPRMEMDPGYYEWLFHTAQFADEFYKWGHGIVDDLWTTGWSEMKKILIPRPPLDEQSKISQYLDLMCTDLDSAIENAKLCIEDLLLYKQSIITEFVTHGINNGSILKETNVLWLKSIPENWNIVPLKRFIDILPGYAFSSDDFAMQGIPLLRGVNVTPFGTRWEDIVYWDGPVDAALQKFMLKEGDLVVGLDRPWINGGTRATRINATDLPCLLLQRVCRIRCEKGLLPDLVLAWLKSKVFEHALSSETTGISVPHISTSQIGNFIIAIPPMTEQETIVNRINEITTSVTEAVEEKQVLIRNLEAYRKSLIYEVVTGKRKVV